jgi:hypothetical protein
MAAYTVSTAIHETLTPDEVDVVTITGLASYITVFNHSVYEGSDFLYFTVGDNPATPTVEGNNTFIVPPFQSFTVKFDGTNTKVALISQSALFYSVIALENR